MLKTYSQNWRWAPWGLFAAYVLVAVFATMLPSWHEALVFRRQGVGLGLYRLVTGGWVHVSAAHLALNAAGLALLVVATSESARVKALLGFPLACLAVMVAERLVGHQSWACGWSGALHCYAVALLAGGRRDAGTLVISVGAMLKATVESLWGSTPATAALVGAPVLTSHHAYGAALGLGVVVAWFALRRPTKAPPTVPSLYAIPELSAKPCAH